MACKLTYKGQRFDTKQQLIKHLQLEGVLDQLMKTNLAKGYEIMSSEEIRNKLIELGVDADVAFQIIGEIGARNLDAFDNVGRLLSKDVYEQLENSVSSKDLWKDTGWYRDIDSKLKMEISDSKLRKSFEDIKEEYWEGYNEMVLGDLIKSPELFKAYPDIEYLNVELYEDSSSSVRGSLRTNSKWGFSTIRLNLDRIHSGDDMLSVLSHELQHNIQKIEGFGRGSNLTNAQNEYFKSNFERLKTERMNQSEKSIEFISRLIDLITYLEDRGNYIVKIEKLIKNRIQKYKGRWDAESETDWYKTFYKQGDKLLELFPDESESIRDLFYDVLPNVYRKAKEYRSILEVLEDDVIRESERIVELEKLQITEPIEIIQQSLSTGYKSEYDYYLSTKGEVEARNVQSRLTLTEEQKQNNSPMTTEDVHEFKQWVQFQKEGVTLLPNGFYHNGKVYINRDTANLDTSIHEFSHSYNQLLKNERPEFYKEGLNLIEKEGKQYIDFVKKNQPNLQGEALLEEALAQAVGDAGAKLIEAEKSTGLKQWLQNAWNKIKEMLGLSSYTIEQVRNMSLQEYTNAVAVDLLRGEEVNFKTPSEEYFERNADRLPLTLAVFNRPEFKAMQGKMVNPITVLNSLNQSGIKQVEKDLIKQIIKENYQGQKKISYDELEATVRANIMPLERIFTSSYADYGMDNLGDGNYGEANTIILNAPIEHGVTGHFSGDFKASGRKNIKYVPKQLNDNTWVAVEEGYESQANDNNIYQFVGTAGTKEAVENWIVKYDLSQGKIFDNKKYLVYQDAFDQKDNVIPVEGFDTEQEAKNFIEKNKDNFSYNLDYVDENYIREKWNLEDTNKGMFGHIRAWETLTEKNTISVSKEQAQKLLSEGTWIYTKHGDKLYRLYDERDLNDANNYVKMGKIFHVAELQSDYFQKNNARKDVLIKNKQYSEIQDKIKNKSKEIDRKEAQIDSEKYKVDILDWENYAKNILESDKYLVAYEDSLTEDMFKEPITKVEIREQNNTLVYRGVFKRGSQYDTNNPNYEAIPKFVGEGLQLGLATNLTNSARLKNIILKTENESVKSLEEELRILKDELKQLGKNLLKTEDEVVKNLPKDQKQFIASQKEWEKRMVREAIKEASLSGATSLRFPTPYTLSVIEGYVKAGETSEYSRDINTYLSELNGEPNAGDIFDFMGELHIVTNYIDWDNSVSITKLRNYDRIEAGEQFDEQEYPYFIETDEYTYIARVEPQTENISLDENTTSKDDFEISSLSDTQQTVARKYEEIAQILETERGDNFEVITDENGFDWYETKMATEEVNSPVIAFQVISPETNDIRYQIGLEQQKIENKIKEFKQVNNIGLKITVNQDKLKSVKEDIDSCSI